MRDVEKEIQELLHSCGACYPDEMTRRRVKIGPFEVDADSVPDECLYDLFKLDAEYMWGKYGDISLNDLPKIAGESVDPKKKVPKGMILQETLDKSKPAQMYFDVGSPIRSRDTRKVKRKDKGRIRPLYYFTEEKSLRPPPPKGVKTLEEFGVVESRNEPKIEERGAPSVITPVEERYEHRANLQEREIKKEEDKSKQEQEWRHEQAKKMIEYYGKRLINARRLARKGFSMEGPITEMTGKIISYVDDFPDLRYIAEDWMYADLNTTPIDEEYLKEVYESLEFPELDASVEEIRPREKEGKTDWLSGVYVTVSMCDSLGEVGAISDEILLTEYPTKDELKGYIVQEYEEWIKDIKNSFISEGLSGREEMQLECISKVLGIENPLKEWEVEKYGKEEPEEQEAKSPIPKGLIPLDLAIRSREGISFTPEREGEIIVKEFDDELEAIYKELLRYVKTEAQKKYLDYWIKDFAEKYAEKEKDYLSSMSEIYSPMIAGPSKFPTERMRKRNEITDRKLHDMLEWEDKQIERAKKDLKKVAVEEEGGEIAHLEKEIDQLKEQLEKEKEANKIIRKKNLSDEEKIEELMNLGYSRTTASELLKPDIMGNIGYAGYELSSIRNKIKTREERLKQLKEKEQKAKGGVENKILFEGGYIYWNYDIDRLQIFFEKIPPEEVRSALKHSGWHWSRSQGAWQRKITNAAEYSAKSIIKKYYGKGLNTEKPNGGGEHDELLQSK